MAVTVERGLQLSEETKIRFKNDGFFGNWAFESAYGINGEVLTASMNGKEVGVLFAIHYTDQFTAFVSYLYVVQEARRFGVGTALMKRMEESCVEKGETTLNVISLSSSLGFYRRVGMFPSNRTETRDFICHTNLSHEDLVRTRGGHPPCVGKLTKIIRKKRRTNNKK